MPRAPAPIAAGDAIVNGGRPGIGDGLAGVGGVSDLEIGEMPLDFGGQVAGF